MSSVPSIEPPPPKVGHWHLRRPLASGAMGAVYLGHHALTHATAAVKLLHREVASTETGEQRFLREVRAAARIGHDGIVKVLDAGRSDDGRLYLAMELLEGESFDQRLQQPRTTRLDALELLLGMLGPLAAAHRAGIVHRDLKPENLFVVQPPQGPEHLKILDFGIARDTGSRSATATGVAVGTPWYMSPEQATTPSRAAPPADVWSVGVMLFEILAGEPPFDGESPHAVIVAACTRPLPPLGKLAPRAHPRLRALVERCLAKNPDQRPTDAAALQEELGDVLADPAVRQSVDVPVLVPLRSPDGSVSTWVEPEPPKRRWVAGAALTVGAILVVASLTVGFLGTHLGENGVRVSPSKSRGVTVDAPPLVEKARQASLAPPPESLPGGEVETRDHEETSGEAEAPEPRARRMPRRPRVVPEVDQTPPPEVEVDAPDSASTTTESPPTEQGEAAPLSAVPVVAVPPPPPRPENTRNDRAGSERTGEVAERPVRDRQDRTEPTESGDRVPQRDAPSPNRRSPTRMTETPPPFTF